MDIYIYIFTTDPIAMGKHRYPTKKNSWLVHIPTYSTRMKYQHIL